MSGYPPISQLLPHGEPIRMLDQLVDWAPGHATCTMRVRETSPFVENGMLPSPFLLEPMAQNVAACLGYEAYREGRGTRVGMIVSCRDYRVHRHHTRVGDELELTAERESGSDALSRFACSVQRGGELVANATMTLIHAETRTDAGSSSKALRDIVQ